MYLSQWITTMGGTGKTADKLGVRRNVVYAWLNGVASPRLGMMKTIVQKSGGQVTYADMVDEHIKMKAKSGKKASTKKVKAAKTVKVGKTKKKKTDPGF